MGIVANRECTKYILASSQEESSIDTVPNFKPACVNEVASAMTKGTFTTRASVFASNVFPVLQSGKEG